MLFHSRLLIFFTWLASIEPRYLLRALGFDLVNVVPKPWTSPEPPKAIVRQSQWIAFSRCSIHVVPSICLVFLIFLNSSGLYLGPSLSSGDQDDLYIALLLITAKILEILCVASLTTVVLHIIRHELMNDGIPLGLLGSGISLRSLVVSGPLRC